MSALMPTKRGVGSLHCGHNTSLFRERVKMCRNARTNNKNQQADHSHIQGNLSIHHHIDILPYQYVLQGNLKHCFLSPFLFVSSLHFLFLSFSFPYFSVCYMRQLEKSPDLQNT
jgi:hypothetical protein